MTCDKQWCDDDCDECDDSGVFEFYRPVNVTLERDLVRRMQDAWADGDAVAYGHACVDIGHAIRKQVLPPPKVSETLIDMIATYEQDFGRKPTVIELPTKDFDRLIKELGSLAMFAAAGHKSGVMVHGVTVTYA